MALLEPLKLLTDQCPHGRKHGYQGDGFYLTITAPDKKAVTVYMLLKDHETLNLTILSCMWSGSTAIYFLLK